MRGTTAALASSVLLIAAAYFVPARAQSPLPAGVSIEDLLGTMLRASKWEQSDIPVCWENPSSATEPFQKVTAKAVAETWETHAPITFSGWGACKPESKGIRIQIADVGIDGGGNAPGVLRDAGVAPGLERGPALDVLPGDPIGVCNRIPSGDGTYNRSHGSLPDFRRAGKASGAQLRMS